MAETKRSGRQTLVGSAPDSGKVIDVVLAGIPMGHIRHGPDGVVVSLLNSDGTDIRLTLKANAAAAVGESLQLAAQAANAASRDASETSLQPTAQFIELQPWWTGWSPSDNHVVIRKVLDVSMSSNNVSKFIDDLRAAQKSIGDRNTLSKQ
jgi:hypothetical protein